MEAFHVEEDDVSDTAPESWAKALFRQASSQRVAVTASWIVNWFLLVAKIVVFALSHSKAVLAALADSAGVLRGRAGVISLGRTACAAECHSPSLLLCPRLRPHVRVCFAVDLASQGVLAVAERHIKRHDARYPVGRARLEALGVLGCATLMSMAAVEVIQYSVRVPVLTWWRQATRGGRMAFPPQASVLD